VCTKIATNIDFQSYSTLEILRYQLVFTHARKQCPNYSSISEIHDQESCGSCWTFGEVYAMSDRVCIASGQQQQVTISVSDLMSCCSICSNGCKGGLFGPTWCVVIYIYYFVLY